MFARLALRNIFRNRRRSVITLAVIGAITLLSDNVRAAIENVAGILPG